MKENHDALILSFDVGTQSTRALLVSQHGEIVAKAQKKYERPYISPQPDWAEQDADMYWEALQSTSCQLKASAPEAFKRILCVCLTTIRDTCVCVDKQGKPLRPAIVWMDKRESHMTNKYPAHKSALITLVGMKDAVELQRKISACNWIKEQQPQIWEKTYKFLLLSTYLTFKLTGEMADADASMIAHVPFNNKKRTWMKKHEITREIFDIEDEKLPRLVPSGTLLGYITKEASEKTGILQGTKFYATGSDKGCETLGLSVTTPDKAAISFGTTATIQLTTPTYMEPLPFLPAYAAVLPGHWNPEVQIYRGYWLISWFKKEFAQKEVRDALKEGLSAEELLNRRLKEIPAGCEGLMMQPYFTPGIAMPKARGAIIGFSDRHTRIHIYRAIIEGINFALMDGLKTMEKRGGHHVKEIYVAGGGSQSDEICQITANMFGLPVKRIQSYEACGIGCAMVGFVSEGIFSSFGEAVAQMVHTKDLFLPDIAEHKTYQWLFDEIFTQIFNRLSPLYRKSFPQ